MNKLLAGALVVGFSLAATGCASIVHGTNEKFTFVSKPTHASVTMDGTKVGKTPTVLNLSRRNNHYISIKLPGYNVQTIYLQKTVSGWAFGNILFGGLIGVGIDAVDGAMYKLTPSDLNVYSPDSKVRYTKNMHKFVVVLVKNPSKNWKKIGQLQHS